MGDRRSSLAPDRSPVKRAKGLRRSRFGGKGSL
jgi:hypothetical protein